MTTTNTGVSRHPKPEQRKNSPRGREHGSERDDRGRAPKNTRGKVNTGHGQSTDNGRTVGRDMSIFGEESNESKSKDAKKGGCCYFSEPKHYNTFSPGIGFFTFRVERVIVAAQLSTLKSQQKVRSRTCIRFYVMSATRPARTF